MIAIESLIHLPSKMRGVGGEHFKETFIEKLARKNIYIFLTLIGNDESQKSNQWKIFSVIDRHRKFSLSPNKSSH